MKNAAYSSSSSQTLFPPLFARVCVIALAWWNNVAKIIITEWTLRQNNMQYCQLILLEGMPFGRKWSTHSLLWINSSFERPLPLFIDENINSNWLYLLDVGCHFNAEINCTFIIIIISQMANFNSRMPFNGVGKRRREGGCKWLTAPHLPFNRYFVGLIDTTSIFHVIML